MIQQDEKKSKNEETTAFSKKLSYMGTNTSALRFRTVRVKEWFQMISMELLREGYCSGVVRIEDEDFIGGAACFIGDSHFYFEIGDEGSSDNYSSEELLNIYDEEELLECIFLTLENFREDWEDMGNEYQYYDFYLHEQLGIPYDE